MRGWLLILLLGAALPAQEAAVPDPRRNVAAFLQAMERLRTGPDDPLAWERVYAVLDLPRAAGEARRDLAWHLYGFLLAVGFDQPEKVPLPPPEELAREKVRRLELFPHPTAAGGRALLLPVLRELGAPPEGARLDLILTDTGWKFSRESLDEVRNLFEWAEPRAKRLGFDIGRYSTAARLRLGLPPALRRSFLGLEVWQWLGLFLAILLGVAADFFGRLLLRPVLGRLVARYIAAPPEGSVRLAVRPLGLALGALVYLTVLLPLGLSGTALTILTVVGKLVLIVGVVWAAWAATDLVAQAFLERARRTPGGFDDMLVPLLRKSVKLFLVALGLIYIADSLDIALGPLLASFGLAGLAVSFAARDTIQNLFGGFTIFLERPFKVGDRVLYGGYDGVIEEIGFRSTRLRTLTGHLVTIPNGKFTQDAVENVAARPFIRRLFHVTITYDTPKEKIEEAVAILRRILAEDGIRERIHPTINGSEYPPRVYFNDFNADSLNIIVIYWFSPPAYWDFLAHAQRVNLRIFEEFERAGIEFAFPTRTLYLAGDTKRELVLRVLSRDLEREAGSRGGD